MAAKKNKGATVVDLTLAAVKAISKKLDRLGADHGSKLDALAAKVDHLSRRVSPPCVAKPTARTGASTR